MWGGLHGYSKDLIRISACVDELIRGKRSADLANVTVPANFAYRSMIEALKLLNLSMRGMKNSACLIRLALI